MRKRPTGARPVGGGGATAALAPAGASTARARRAMGRRMGPPSLVEAERRRQRGHPAAGGSDSRTRVDFRPARSTPRRMHPAKETPMGRIVVTEFISLDGVVEDPGGAENTRHGGWTFRFNDPEGMQFKLDELKQHDAHLLGRVTYEGFAEAWPERTDELGFAERMNAMKKYVVSSTLKDPSWNNSEVLGPDLKAEVERIKAEDGGDILVAGSIRLVQGLLALALVAEWRLMVFPIIRGGGGGGGGESEDDITLALAGVQRLGSGTVILTYRRPSAD